MLPIHTLDNAATSQDGTSQEFVAANEGRECYIQDARCRGLGPKLRHILRRFDFSVIGFFF